MRHPLHPMFVHFPIALWATSLAFDALALRLGDASWWSLSYRCIAAGLLMALPAIGTGFVEFVRVAPDHPASRTVVGHMSAMCGATVLFLGGLLVRAPGSPPASIAAAMTLSLAGLACLIAGGALASRLVYGYGVGSK